MNGGEVRRRLLGDLLAVGAPYGLALAGGDAVRAHGLVDRPGQGIDVATESPVGTGDIVAAVRAGLEERGWRVRTSETEPLAARLVVGDLGVVGGEEAGTRAGTGAGTEAETGAETEAEAGAGTEAGTEAGTGAETEAGASARAGTALRQEFAVQVVKEVLWRPLEVGEFGPVLSLEDLVGTRVRALAGQGLAPDLVDVHAAADRWSHPELEELGRRHAGDVFDLADLQTRLVGAEWIDDRAFAACGLDDRAIAELRRWAQEWADDIGERLAESAAPPEDE
ncbi:hypothetical protein AB0A91_01115 [Streptomyces sp. NPDC042207]|uniref:hypothetical protein n=1 Tax=Streptomyces sp. NPDC042207 TaxID=3154331 RepID=UPI0033CA4A0F